MRNEIRRQVQVRSITWGSRFGGPLERFLKLNICHRTETQHGARPSLCVHVLNPYVFFGSSDQRRGVSECKLIVSPSSRYTFSMMPRIRLWLT